ncbi:MAG: efflux RND transporter permease subunit [Sphingomonadales bacterium]|nr:efflux RND transporter permease subunit [Sphingomonadales bacterium]PIX67216.1 MAG: AcrB/AcrD/AcrF family protein [Sphingomonadales bacterium CG_4_10_14_3_um_filter_58_15]NCO48648.1 efflux RND transporter permease subunit [Sphingomonadales bacterium]NCO99607.1 efflux RND transporter permease subunit [Sphingomonadales bacterium]NCP27115.1 efflux RND transporter permease subunit [Sphingomonadales bacterium]
MTESTDQDPAQPEQPSKEVMEQRGIVAFMARNGVAANLLMIFLIVAGIMSYRTIVQEVFAENSLDTIQISVAYPGATPDEIEESIVQKIEEAVEAVENVKEVKSTAAENVGTVSVELQLGADIDRALDDIKAEIDQIQSFPDDAEEPDVRELTTRQSVVRIAIFGDVSENALKETAHRLEDALAALPEISFVDTSSIRDYEVSIEVPQDTLQAFGLSLNDISRTVAASSLDSPAGSIDTETEEVRVRTIGQNYNQKNFEDIVLVSNENGAMIRLGQIATIRDEFEDSDLVSLYNGKPVAFVEVFRTSDERVLDVSRATKDYLEGEFAHSLPEGISYAIWSDDSELLDDRLSLLLKNAAIGLFLVLLALTLFLDIRLAGWTALGIGVTFIGAIFLLDIAGSSINMFSLFGFILALGLVVDDAIVVGESVYARRESGRTGMGAAISGARRVTMPVIFAVLTTVAAFSPLFAIGGVIGKILADIPLVVVSVLFLSLVESLLILPNHLSHLPAPGTVNRNPVTRFFERVQEKVDVYYQAFVNGPLDRAVRYSVRMPFVILAGSVALLIIIGSLVPAGIIKSSFFPAIEADVVTASLEMPAGTTIAETERIARLIEQGGREAYAKFEARTDEGDPSPLRAIFTLVGKAPRASGPNAQSGGFASNIASVQFSFIPGDQRELASRDFENAWRETVGPIVEARSLVFASDLISIGAPVDVQISDPDPSVVEAASTRLMERLNRFAGVFDIESDQDEGLTEIQLRLKPEARSLGVTLQDVALQVRAAFFGSEALRVQRGQEDMRVYIRLPEAERNSIVDVERFRVRVPGGEVPLATLADVSFGQAPAIIRRTDGRRITTVTADIDTHVVTSQEIATALTNDIMPALQADYPQLLYSFGGEQQEQQDSFGDLGLAFLAALLMIYALLAIPFRSYLQPLIIMAVIPFGIIGALIGHLILGLPLGVLSMFGIIALSGVIVNGSLILIDFINENLSDGMAIEEAIISATKSRFRPIMLTSLTTFLGVAPITFETSLQAQFLIPMSASLGFGVLFGAIILQLLIPALTVLEYVGKRRVEEYWKNLTAHPSEA